MKKIILLFMIVLCGVMFLACGEATDKKNTTAGLKQTSEETLYGFAMRNTLWWTFPFFNTYGAEFISGDKCVLNNEAGIAAMQMKVDLYTKHKVEAGAWQAGAISPDTGFLNEKYAMIFDGPWDVKRFKDAGMNFGVSLIPEGPEGSSTNVGGTNMVVFNNSKNPYWAAKFLEFLSSPEIQAYWCNKLEQIPVNLKAYDLMDTENNPILATFMEQMKKAKARPNIMDYGELEEIINPQMEAALKGQKTVKEAMDYAAERIEKEILANEKNYKIYEGKAQNYSKEQKGTVKIWVTYNPTELKVFSEIVSKFETKYSPVKVVVEPIPWGGHQQKILTAAATNSTPDIARVDGSFTYKLAHKNAIYNLSQFGIENIMEDLTPAASGACFFKGKLWAVPDQITGVALFYNKDLFAEKGIMDPPVTWEEFIDVAKKLTQK